MADLNFDGKLNAIEKELLESLNKYDFEKYTGAPNKLLAGFIKDQILVYSKFLSDMRKELSEEENVIEVDSHQTPIV